MSRWFCLKIRAGDAVEFDAAASRLPIADHGKQERRGRTCGRATHVTRWIKCTYADLEDLPGVIWIIPSLTEDEDHGWEGI